MEQTVGQEAKEVLDWIVDGTPCPHNPLYSRRKGPERSRLLQALRDELQTRLLQTGEELNTVRPPDRNRNLRVLHAYLLSFFPYFEPETGSHLRVHQEEKENQWKPIEYRVRRLDLTPQSGIFAGLFKEEDRLYACALEPLEKALPYLLFMGTPFPINHGSNLGVLRNFSILGSAGEGHDLTQTHEWIKRQTQFETLGHSNGSIQAMLIAVKNPDKVPQAIGFCSPKLRQLTVSRLAPLWQRDAHPRPRLRVYTPQGDFLNAFGSGYLRGTEVYEMVYDRKSNQIFDIHVPCGAGNASFHLVDVTGRKKQTLIIDFLSNISIIGFPLLYFARLLKLYHKLLADKYGKRYQASVALVYLGLNWLLYKKVFKSTRAFWSLVAGLLLVQKSHKAAQVFWGLLHGTGGLAGILFAALVTVPQRALEPVCQDSSLAILMALKKEGANLARRCLPLGPINQLGETAIKTGRFCALLYALKTKHRPLPGLLQAPDKKAQNDESRRACCP